MQQLQRPLSRQAQLLRQRRDVQLGTKALQHGQHEEVRTLEAVAREPRARLAEHARRWRGLGGERHVARLAGLLARIGTGPPLQVRNLLGEAPPGLGRAAGARARERRRVQRVAGGAELGDLHVRGTLRPKPRRRMHDLRARSRDVVGTAHQTFTPRSRGVDPEFGVVLEPGTAVLQLMTERARDTVDRERIGGALLRAAAEVREDLALLSSDVRLEARHRHVAGGALVLNERRSVGMVGDLAPHRRLPVGIASGVGHDRRPPGEADGNVFTRWSGDAVVAGEASIRCGKQRRRRAGARRCDRERRGRDEERERGYQVPLSAAMHVATSPQAGSLRTSPRADRWRAAAGDRRSCR